MQTWYRVNKVKWHSLIELIDNVTSETPTTITYVQTVYDGTRKVTEQKFTTVSAIYPSLPQARTAAVEIQLLRVRKALEEIEQARTFIINLTSPGE